jgi:hypothetical protein
METAYRKTLFFGLLLTIVLIFPWSAHSRIGETLNECEARYGNPLEVKRDAALFLKNGMSVYVHFVSGKVDEIAYYKKDSKDSKKSVCPTDAEVRILVQANAQDTLWEFEAAHRRDALWRNKEKGLSAFRAQQALTISASDPIAYKAHHEQKAAARDLEGFYRGRFCLDSRRLGLVLN